MTLAALYSRGCIYHFNSWSSFGCDIILKAFSLSGTFRVPCLSWQCVDFSKRHSTLVGVDFVDFYNLWSGNRVWGGGESRRRRLPKGRTNHYSLPMKMSDQEVVTENEKDSSTLQMIWILQVPLSNPELKGNPLLSPHANDEDVDKGRVIPYLIPQRLHWQRQHLMICPYHHILVLQMQHYMNYSSRDHLLRYCHHLCHHHWYHHCIHHYHQHHHVHHQDFVLLKVLRRRRRRKGAMKKRI